MTDEDSELQSSGMEGPEPTVGIVGLGVMGSAYAGLLLEAGYRVLGFDPSPDATDRFCGVGGVPCDTPRDLGRKADIFLIALPSVAALDDAITGAQGLVHSMRSGVVLCEMGTFSVADKERLAAAVSETGAVMLDCPVSGTGAQAKVGDLVVYASGDRRAVDRARPTLEALSREVRYVGGFGAGMTMKIVANLLVSIHNLAAAEALLLAERSGLDLPDALEALTAGAGTSRMLEVRGPLMISETYEPATMKHSVFAKDLDLIMEHARISEAPVPLMSAAVRLYEEAIRQGRGAQDTASLFSVLKDLDAGPDEG